MIRVYGALILIHFERYESSHFTAAAAAATADFFSSKITSYQTLCIYTLYIFDGFFIVYNIHRSFVVEFFDCSFIFIQCDERKYILFGCFE